MADITTVNEITQSGLVSLEFTGVNADGDKYENGGRLFVVIRNQGEETCTVTFTAQKTSFVSPQYGDASLKNETLAVLATTTGYIGPFPSSTFNDADGYVNLTYSVSEGVSVAICSL